MRIIIDRLDGNFAVVELPNGKFINVPKELFDGAGEGDVIDIKISKVATAKKRKNIQAQFNRLKK